ncbi:MAG: chemotaxis protein, partial [Alphaproteobacteria bacterium]|nr:chemotaxis protein [Alphaproteobacteria bacterium]
MRNLFGPRVRRVRPLESPLPSGPSPSGGEEDADALAAALDLLIEGKYLSVPEGAGPLSRKIKAAAEAVHARGQDELRFLVDMSLNVNEAVTCVAEMMRDVREVDGRSQGIASASEELVASVGEIFTTSEAAALDAGEAERFASQGRIAAEQAVETMDRIARAVENAASKVDGLADASAQIGGIVQQIEAIARQTNLLALNATIEAARAGEAGKGFAVVATEVKNLANQTAKATENIRSRINMLLEEMAAIVSSMENGASAVQQGQGVIAATGESMRQVADRIHGVSAKMVEIAQILDQQTAASSEVSSGINGIATMSTRNVHSIEGVMDVMDKADSVITTSVGAMATAELRNFTIHIAKSDHAI